MNVLEEKNLLVEVLKEKTESWKIPTKSQVTSGSFCRGLIESQKRDKN